MERNAYLVAVEQCAERLRSQVEPINRNSVTSLALAFGREAVANELEGIRALIIKGLRAGQDVSAGLSAAEAEMKGHAHDEVQNDGMAGLMLNLLCAAKHEAMAAFRQELAKT